jgi:hypothetical protein
MTNATQSCNMQKLRKSGDEFKSLTAAMVYQAWRAGYAYRWGESVGVTNSGISSNTIVVEYREAVGLDRK